MKAYVGLSFSAMGRKPTCIAIKSTLRPFSLRILSFGVKQAENRKKGTLCASPSSISGKPLLSISLNSFLKDALHFSCVRMDENDTQIFLKSIGFYLRHILGQGIGMVTDCDQKLGLVCKVAVGQDVVLLAD